MRILAGFLTLLCVATSLGSCDRGQAAPNQASLLDRAVAAAGGDKSLAAIKSVETRSRGEHPGKRAYQAVIQRLLPDRYRHDVDVSDARLVQGTDGADVWATLDDYPIEVTPAEAESLRLSWRLAEVSMLLPLKTSPGIRIKEEGKEDDGEVLRVVFPKDPKVTSTPTYRLFFDPSTSLLRQIVFDAVIFGADEQRQTRIELSDYRKIDGVMVPFQSKMTVDHDLMEERVEQITFNPALAPERFKRPPAPTELVIKSRKTAEVTVAILEQPGTRPEAATEAEAALERYLEKYHLQRNGPPFRLQPMSESDLPAVGTPIAPPPPETRPTTRPTTRELPRISILPARDVLTTVIPGDDPAKRSAAIEKLLSHARADGCEPDGPVKIVFWSRSPDVVQLQLPVRARKG